MAYLLMIVDAYVQEVQLYSNTYKDHIHFYHWGIMFRKALYELPRNEQFGDVEPQKEEKPCI